MNRISAALILLCATWLIAHRTAHADTNAGAVIVVRDRDGKEKLRIRLGPGEKVEIAQEGTELPEPKREVPPGSKSDQPKPQTNDSALALRKPSGRFTVFAPLWDKQSIDQLLEPLRKPRDLPVMPWELAHKTGGELKAKSEALRAAEIVTALADMKPDDAGVLLIVMNGEGFEKIGKYDPSALKRQRIIGIGYGAAKLFGELGLEINWGACAHGTAGEPRLTVVENGLVPSAKFPSPFFAFEPPIIDSKDFHNAFFFGVYLGPDKKLRRDLKDVIALQTNDKKYAAVVRQGRHILVCIDAPLDKWSPDLKRLVTELAVSLDTHSPENSDGESGKKNGGSNRP